MEPIDAEWQNPEQKSMVNRMRTALKMAQSLTSSPEAAAVLAVAFYQDDSRSDGWLRETKESYQRYARS